MINQPEQKKTLYHSRQRNTLKNIALIKRKMTPGNLLFITYAIVIAFIGIVKLTGQ